MKFALSIAGFDPTTSAGITLDVLIFRSLGIYPLTVPTVLTVQTPAKVREVIKVCSDYVNSLLKTLLERFRIAGVKVSVLGSPEVASVVSDYLEKLECPIVADPVIRAGDGTVLTDPETLRVVEDKILPRATIVTPNVHEAEILAKMEIKTIDDMRAAAEAIAQKYGVEHVLIKGGHLPQGDFVVDVFYDRGSVYTFTTRRIYGKDVHGTGCVFSAAITAYLARGLSVPDAIREAKRVIEYGIRYSIDVGEERRLVNAYSIVEIELERYRVIERLKDALKMLENSSEYIVELIPEVRSNLVYALPSPYAEDITDVAGVPGRITCIGKKIVPVGEPTFGGSSHLARAVLTIMKYFPDVRSCMNIRYMPELVEIARELGYRIAFFNRAEEPLEVKQSEGRSIVWGIERAVRGLKEPPDIVYDLGDHGKEPQIRIFGRDPVEVVYKVVRLAVEYLKRRS